MTMPYLKILKSKWLWAAIITVTLFLFVYHYGNIRENLSEAYARVNNLVVALETSNQSIKRMEDELERIDQYIQQREQERSDIEDEFDQIRSELQAEIQSNQRLQECWDVPIENPSK